MPRSHTVPVANLKINVLEWVGPDNAPTVLLQHGFLDVAASWTPVAERLAEHWRVLAVDARGHGDSDWVGDGGYYHFYDYMRDLTTVIETLVKTPLHLVGHSMGGMICAYYAGACPQEVASFVCIEGLGPPAMDAEQAPAKLAIWIADLKRAETRKERRFASLRDVADRLQAQNNRLTEATAHQLARWQTRLLEDGQRGWKFDPLHQTRSPQPVYEDHLRAFFSSITCPVLLVNGQASGFMHYFGDRASCFSNARSVTVDAAGHMIHHEQAERLAELIESFISENCDG